MDFEYDKIYIKMFGGLRITLGNKSIVETEGRAKKVWMLIEYLISNRSIDISQDKLFESCWEDEEFDSPFNTLKNLVYRARRQLSELDTINKKLEYILFTRNTYKWNNQMACEIDTEVFQKNYDLAANVNLSADERIEYYKQAIDLYKGDFLPKSLFANWAINKNAYYSNLYTECVNYCCELLLNAERYDEIINICERAIDIYIFEEDFHKFLLIAYIKTEQVKKARAHYDQLIDLFYKELNVSISDSFKDIYSMLINSSEVETDFSIIKNDLFETFNQPGAYFCDYNIFKNIYRLQARSIQRTGQTTHIGLITLKDLTGEDLRPGETEQVMINLKNIIIGSLRKSDTLSQYSYAQYVVMLPLTTIENADLVISRIANKFNNLYKKKNLYISYRVTPVDPIT